MAKKQQKKRTSRKAGRNKLWCRAYIRACRREINKRKKVARHCRRFPADLEAQKVLDRLTA